ncbi:MAG: hypothetical protein RSC76_05780 [Oscillospiraceae bacterium]
MEKKKKQVAIACVALALVVAILGIVYIVFVPKGTAGTKNIVVEIVHQDQTTNSVKISTSAEYLRGALEQEKLVSGTESEYGLFIVEADGETADAAAQEWWCVTKGGETVTLGVDKQPISDGEKYELTLTAGY